MAAVLACGAGTVLSHQSAGALWGIGAEPVGQIEVSVPAGSVNQRPGIRVHRRPRLWSEDLDVRNHVPVTSPVRTLIDLATQLDPDLGLVVETDGLRYHRTPAQQARDRLRDQAHAAAGLTPLRFTHAQVRFEVTHVRATLVAVAGRLEEAGRAMRA